MTMPPSPLDMQSTLATALAGRYTITRELGRGGMATVYLANDLKHQRQVAIKVLLPELGAVLGAERFLSEIRVTANLQHPNLLPLFDSGDANGLLYYVMPYVEGETLRARLDREQQLPVEEAVRLARTMAGALDYAHQRGVIHRDLKPENVLLQAGQPVIADFGIALAVAQAGGQRVTQTGLSLGTPQYMSPEQATGDKQLDGRTDIYALGAMTYEMLTGEPPHVGNSAQAIIAKLMTDDVRPLTVLRKSVPASMDGAVRRALEKLPADRFATAGAFAMALGDSMVSAERYAPAVPRTNVRALAVTAALAVLLTAPATWLLVNRAVGGTAAADATQVTRFVVKVDPRGTHALGGVRETEYGRPATNSLAMSLDGNQIVYAAWDSLGSERFTSHLYVRRLTDEAATEMPGTEGAAHPAFSDDGRWVAFTNTKGIARVRIDGGEVQSVAPTPDACCLAWWGRDTLVFSDSSFHLQKVAAGGGRPIPLPITLPERVNEPRFLQPIVLADAGLVLFHVRTLQGQHPDSSAIYRFDERTGKTVRILSNAADPKVLAHEFLLFMRRGTLMAVRFDERSGAVQGEPVMVVDDVMHALNMPHGRFELGTGQYAVSQHGDLVYARGGEFVAPSRDLVRVMPDGSTQVIALGLPYVVGPRISPAGDRISFSAAISERSRVSAIFVHDLKRHATTRVIEGGAQNTFAQWSADGRSLAFRSDRDSGVTQVFVAAADGSNNVRRVVSAPTSLSITTWSLDGRFGGITSAGDIYTAREGEALHVFFTTPERERYATFSPDGKWLAYSAAKGPRTEVFVRPYPGPDPSVQVSVDGGHAPAWAKDGRSIYFLSEDVRPAMKRVVVATNNALAFSVPTTVVSQVPFISSEPNRGYDVLTDGSFIGVAAVGGAPEPLDRSKNKVTEFHAVLNFLSELRARVR